MYQGARFSITRKDVTSIKLKFEAALAWFSYPISEECLSWEVYESEQLERFGEPGFEVSIDAGKSK
jgi:hypothetical protein